MDSETMVVDFGEGAKILINLNALFSVIILCIEKILLSLHLENTLRN